MGNIIAWVLKNGASVLGITQAVIKFAKEIITALINLFAILNVVKAQEFVAKSRLWVEKADSFIEKYKGLLLK